MEQTGNQINGIAQLLAEALRGLSGDGETEAELSRLAAEFETACAGSVGAGHVEAGSVENGCAEAGSVEAGCVEAGSVETGRVEAGAADAGEELLGFASLCGEAAEFLIRLGAKGSADPAAVGECAALLMAAFQTVLLRTYASVAASVASGGREADSRLSRRRNSGVLGLKKKYVPRLSRLTGEMEDALLFFEDGK